MSAGLRVCCPQWGATCRIVAVCLLAAGITAAQDTPPTAVSSAGEQIPVRLGALVNQGMDQCRAMWEPTAAYLSEVLGRPVYLLPLPYETVEMAVRNRSVNLLIVNSGQYAVLEKMGLARAIATMMESVGNDTSLPRFGSVIFRRADRADITHISDLAGKRLAAVGPQSFGGWAAALDYMRREGFDPEARCRQILFLDNHNAVVWAVMEGGADVGIVRSGHLEAMAARGEIDPTLFVPLWAHPLDPTGNHAILSTTPSYPNWPCAVVTGTLDESTTLAVGRALIMLTADHPAARAAGLAGWAPPLDYSPVWESLRRAGLVQPPLISLDDFTAWTRSHRMMLVPGLLTGGLVIWLLFRVFQIRQHLLIKMAELSRVSHDLASANARIHALLESGNMVLWEIDENIRFTWLSSNLLDGHTFDITAGTAPVEVVHSEDLAKVHDHLRQCVQDHLPFRDVEFRLRDRDGRWHWVSISGEPFYSDRGTLLGFRGITRSITRQKFLQQAEHTYEQEMIQWFREGPDGFLILRMPEGTIEETNPKLEQMLGFRREELIGRTMRELDVWTDLAAVAQMWHRLQRGETVHQTVPHRRRDGQVIQCAVSARLSDRQNRSRVLAVLHDITEQMAARQVELAWFERMRRLTSAAPGIAYEFRRNPDGSYCLPFASDRMYEFFGLSPEILARSAQPLFDRVHPEDIAEFLLSIQRSERTMGPWRHEFRLRHQNGNWLWFLGQSIPTWDPDGGITWRGFLLDVTESRKLGNTLREQERFLGRLLESLPVGVAVVRCDDGTVVLINPALATMTGHPQESAVGRCCADLLCGGQRETCPLHDVVPDTGYQAELFLVRSDGSRIPTLHTIRPYVTPDGTQYLLMVFTDIRERKQLEDAMRDSEHRYRQLADAIPALVWICDPEGSCVDFNRAWLEYRGRTLDQETGDGWLEGVHPEDRERVLTTFRNALAVRAEFTMIYRLLRHDGVYRWIENHGVPRFDSTGTFLGYAGGCMDVTERQEAAAYLETVMRCVQAGIFVSDGASGLLLDANREAERLTGRPRSELIGQAWHAVLTPEEPLALEPEPEQAWDTRLHTPDHQNRIVRVRQIHGTVGERSLLVQSLMDITDLRRLLESQDIDIALARRLLDAVVRPVRRHVDLGNNLSLFVEPRIWPCQKAGGDHALIRVIHDITGPSLTTLALCDQSGHEVNCVLRGVYTSLVLDNLLRGIRRPLHDRLERLNTLLEQSGVFREAEFVTGWFADLDHDSAILTCAACGQAPALLIRDGEVRLLPEPGGPGVNSPVAILPGTVFTVTAERLKPGDRIITCTDGLLEMPWRHCQRRLSTPMLARILQRIVRQIPDASVRELADTLVAAVSAFAGETVGGADSLNSADDDVSLLLMEIEPVHAATQWTLHPQSDEDLYRSVETITRELVPAWEKQGLRSSEFRLRTVLEEGLSNIWQHGHHRIPDLPIRVRAWARNDFVLELSGYGEGFEPERIPDPRMPDRLLEEHGRGIFLIRRAADSLDWCHEGRTLRAGFRRSGTAALSELDLRSIMNLLQT